MSAIVPFIGPLVSGAFNLAATKARVHGATKAASEIERRNLEARQYLEGTAQRSRDDLLNQSALGRQYLEPYINQGANAVNTLGGEVVSGALNRPFTLADFQRDPGYEFRRTEGLRGIQGEATAGGGLFSGGTLKALDRYNQNFASGEYEAANKRFTAAQGERYKQLLGVSGQGLDAGGQAALMSQQTGTSLLNQGGQLGELGAGYIADTGYAQAQARALRGSAYGSLYANLGQQLSGPIAETTDRYLGRRKPQDGGV